MISQEKIILDVPPRNVRLKPFSSVWRFWLSHLFLIGLYLLISVDYLRNQAIPFWAYYFGLSSEATITQKWVLDTGSGRYRSIHPTLSVQYERGPADIRVSYETYRAVHAGDKLGLHYFPWAAQRLSADMNHPEGVGLWFKLIFQLIILLLVPWETIFILTSVRKQKKLLIDGRTATAVIQRRSRNRYQYTFEWENKIWKGVWRNNDLFHGAYAGNDLLVLYDPERPKTNLAYVPQQWVWEVAPTNQERF